MPIIAVTTEDMPDGLQKRLQAGMNGYLTKPFTKADFQAVLEHWLPPNEDESC